MKFDAYPTRKESVNEGNLEQEPNVPIIDFIRHGETERKSYQGFTVQTGADGFALDSTHLDLTPEGISTIQKTAEDLAGMINIKNEVVLMVTSPSPRAHSSALIVEKALRDKGINILNNAGELKFFEALNETGSRLWKLQKEYPAEGDEMINRRRREIEALLFQRFLRRMNNVYHYLKPETLKKLEGKRLRIICFTHAEIARDFIRESFDDISSTQTTQKKGSYGNSQILEIKMQSPLHEGRETKTDVKLYPTAKRPGKETRIVKGFKPKQ